MRVRANLKSCLIMAMFLIAMACPAAVGQIIYVDADANGVNDGSSWTDAYNYLQDALADANSATKPVEIRVAEGIYTPDSNSADPNGTGDRTATFQLINGVTLKGGHAGYGEPDANERDIEIYETVLSGDLAGNDVDVNNPADLLDEPTRGENSYHVVSGSWTDATAVLDGFIITGGNANGSSWAYWLGGGMYNNFGSPTVINCAFGKNSALSGGGMYNRSGGPTLTNCMFNRNCAAGTWPHTGGAGMYNDGEEGLCSPTLTNCTFNENFSFACGGGMYNWFLSAPTLTGCSFIGNSAIQGGGIFHPCQGNPKLGNCSFRGNSSTDGGGMWNGGGSPVLVNCIFIENSAYDGGGGMFNCNNSNPILTNCTFNGNMARRGGGMQNGGIDPTLTSCLFSGNSAGQTGGGMRNVSSDPVLQNCIFNGNSAGESGGGMYNRNQSSKRKHGPTLNNCTFAANSAPDGNALACDSIAGAFPNILKMTNCILWDDGNEIWDSGNSIFTINYSNIQDGWSGEGNIDADPCFADAANGDYHLLPDSPCIDVGDPNYMADPNETDLDGKPRVIGGRIDMGAYESPVPAAIYYVDDDANGLNNGSSWADAYNYLQDGLADANSGDEIRVAQGTYKPDQGAGITPGDRTATFQLKNGVAIKGGYAGFGEPDPNAWDFELYETTLSGDLDGNDVDVNDPADLLDEPTRGENSYHVVTGSGTDSNAILHGFTITAGNDNRYEMFPSPYPHLRPIGHGAGMCNHSGSPTLANCTFIRNTANSRGGGMCNWDESSPTITNCTFSGNLAAGEIATGGGMCNYSSRPTLTNCTFSGNSTSYKGGGMCNYSSSLHITNCTFIGNSARDRAGAVYIAGISNQTLTNCIFIDNSARYFGGAMVIDHCNPTLINCTFRNNKTEWHRYGGGGISCDNVAAPTLINCEFTGNVAQESGGGMRNTVSSSPILLNCTFTGNSAGSFGGGIWNRGNSNPTLINCIIWGNEAREGPEIAVVEVWDGSDPSMVTVSYSDVQGGEQDVYVGPGCALIWGDGNIDADPLFVELGYWADVNDQNIVVEPNDPNAIWFDGDYHLLEGSPCIDAGDPNYVAEPNETDLDGKPRIIGGRIDMGAYEYSPPIPVEVRIVPRTINLASKGKWIRCYIWLGEEYDVADIDPNSVLLEGEIQAKSLQVDEQQQIVIVRFSRSEVQGILNAGQVGLTVNGELTDGTIFEGTDTIRVIDKGRRK